MKNLSKTKKIIIGVVSLIVLSIAISYVRNYIEYKNELERIEMEHRTEMQELQELENMYNNGNSYEKHKAYQELREKALRNGLSVYDEAFPHLSSIGGDLLYPKSN